MKVAKFDARMGVLTGTSEPCLWHGIPQPPFRLAGFAWFARDHLFRRVPVKPSETIPEAVDALANCTAGGQIAFRSDSRYVAVRVKLAGLADMNHMPSTGQCGFDLYVGEPFHQRFHNVTKYDHHKTTYECLLFEYPEPALRTFTLNFPLYQGVKKVEIGLHPAASIVVPPPWSLDGRVVFYGTSITQGGCASRPGMAYTNILARALNVEIINLGFSGSGRGEPEVARLVAGVKNPRLFVLDYEANQSFRGLRDTLPQFVRILREEHERVPILIVSRIPFAAEASQREVLYGRVAGRNLQAQFVSAARAGGDRNIHFYDGSLSLGGDFDECTVDGIHPTDLGFSRMAEGMIPVIRKILHRRS